MKKLWSFLRRAALGAALLLSGGEFAQTQTYPGTQQPWFLTGNITLFVDGSAGSDSNSGMAAGAGNAWATFAPAYKFLCNRTNGNGNSATIRVANASSIVGAGGIGGAFALTCTPLNYAFIILDLGGGTLTPAGGADAITLYAGLFGQGFTSSALHITNGTIVCNGAGAGLHVIQGVAVVESFGGTLTFGACAGGPHIVADGVTSRVFINTGYTISGNATFHLAAIAGGGIDFNTTATITCTGSPAFTAFANVNTGPGWIFVPTGTITFSGCGTATGARYSATGGGAIITNNGGANFFPGSTAGSMASGGRYDSPGTPAVSACGTTGLGAPTGTDMSGSVVEGQSTTGCTLTFTTANAPKSCTVASSSTAVQAGLVISTLNATTLAVSHPTNGATNPVLYWTCPAN